MLKIWKLLNLLQWTILFILILHISFWDHDKTYNMCFFYVIPNEDVLRLLSFWRVWTKMLTKSWRYGFGWVFLWSLNQPGRRGTWYMLEPIISIMLFESKYFNAWNATTLIFETQLLITTLCFNYRSTV